MSIQALVTEFHVAAGQPVGNIYDTLFEKPGTLLRGDEETDKRLDMRVDLVLEEADELSRDAHERNLEGIVDALADIVYVCYGFAVELGVDLDDILREVHRSNMTKVAGEVQYNEAGKVLKPETYEPPSIYERLLEQAKAIGAQGRLF